MEILWFVLMALGWGGGASLIIGLRYRASAERARSWCDLARSYGLTNAVGTVSSFGGSVLVTAETGDLRVRISYQASDEHPRSSLEVHGLKWRGLTLRPESINTALAKKVGAREVELGDRRFDDTFYIGGTPAVALALLDPVARRDLVYLQSSSRVEIWAGVLRVRPHGPGSGEIAPELRRLLEIAEHVGRRHAIVPCLVDNVRNDPEPGVRLGSLRIIIREYRDVSEVEAAVRDACGDPDTYVRLHAAIAVGTEGHPVLRAIIAKGATDDCVAEAVVALGDELTEAEAQAVLASSLKARFVDTARACLMRLGRCGTRPAIETVAKVMAVEEGELAPAAADALGAGGSPLAEAPLQRALGRASLELRVAAAQALGRMGSVRSVVPLKEAAETHRERDFLRAARQAVAEIQSRAGASPGQLSMATVEAGQVSLVEEESGRVSLVDETRSAS